MKLSATSTPVLQLQDYMSSSLTPAISAIESKSSTFDGRSEYYEPRSLQGPETKLLTSGVNNLSSSLKTVMSSAMSKSSVVLTHPVIPIPTATSVVSMEMSSYYSSEESTLAAQSTVVMVTLPFSFSEVETQKQDFTTAEVLTMKHEVPPEVTTLEETSLPSTTMTLQTSIQEVQTWKQDLKTPDVKMSKQRSTTPQSIIIQQEVTPLQGFTTSVTFSSEEPTTPLMVLCIISQLELCGLPVYFS